MKKIYNLNYKTYIILLTLFIAFYASIYFFKLPMTSRNEADFGRDLYVFYLASKGLLPYIDFNWIYGPLVPIIFGLCFKFFGVSILNAVCLWYIVLIISIYLIFFIVKSVSNSFLAFFASVNFLLFYPFAIQTFNHVFGVPFILLSILFLFNYLKTYKSQYLYYLSISSFLLAIIKLNMAMGFSFPIFILLLLFNKLNKKPIKSLIYSFLLFIILSFLVYSLLIINAPIDQIPKSFPYGSKFITHSNYNIITNLFVYDFSLLSFDYEKEKLLLALYYIFNVNIFYILTPLTGLVFSLLIYKKEEKYSIYFIFTLILSIISLFNAHEFFIAGTAYSLRFWVLPISSVLLPFIIYYSLENFPKSKLYRAFIAITALYFFSGIAFQAYNNYLASLHVSGYYPLRRAKVCFNYYPWLLIMNSTINYIHKNVPPEEKLLSIPNNLIYNFISERDQPGRYLEFYYISNLTDNDQYKVIQELEKAKVKIILYGIKTGKINGGVGYFGKTHCQILDKYIKNNYYMDVYYSYIQKDFLYDPICFYKRKTPFKEFKILINKYE